MQHIVQRFWSRGGWQQLAVLVAVLALSSCAGASTVATPTPTPQPSPTATPSGPPALGAPEAIFVAAYGPIVSHPVTGSDWFWADKAHTIELLVTFSSGQATGVMVINRSRTISWTAAYTFNYCHAFLPPGASKVHASGQITIYQSTLGSVILFLNGPDICSVALNR